MKNDKVTLPLPIIVMGIQGDIDSINQILKHFESYILKLSQKTLFDELGHPHLYVEPEIQRILETKLIVAVLNFKLN